MPFEIETFAIFKGSTQDERILHNKYADYRIKGEWFVLNKVEESGVIFDKISFLNKDVIK